MQTPKQCFNIVCSLDFQQFLRNDTYSVMPEPGGPGGPLASQIFGKSVTLFQSGMADYPHLLLPIFFTFTLYYILAKLKTRILHVQS